MEKIKLGEDMAAVFKYLKGCLLEKKKITFFAVPQENVPSGNV